MKVRGQRGRLERSLPFVSIGSGFWHCLNPTFRRRRMKPCAKQQITRISHASASMSSESSDSGEAKERIGLPVRILVILNRPFWFGMVV